jgi:ATP-binding cassette subfamily F protein uup
MTPVKALSGGERNRVLLAKLFSRESNMLVLDEPTNDLDVEMLEVLEEQLVNYTGTLLVVSHDRDFLDNVVTSTLVFEESGKVEQYVGGYSDWARRGLALKNNEDPLQVPGSSQKNVSSSEKTKPKKLSYKLQRELDALPQKIEALEQKVAQLEQEMAAPGFYEQSQSIIQSKTQELAETQQHLETAIERWAELEA